MELRHLRYFIAVAELRSVWAASEQLHVTQPAISRQIRTLKTPSVQRCSSARHAA
ncbi:DNA-binding transcriptional LysR family regulator [Ralstonia pickettii]